MIQKRNAIAHGDRAKQAVQIQTVRKWQSHSRAFGPRLELILAAHIQTQTGIAPPW